MERLLLRNEGIGREASAPAPNPQDAQGCLYHAALLVANEFKSRGLGTTRDGEPTTKTQPCQCSPENHSSEHENKNNPRKRKQRETELPCWDRLEDVSALLPVPEVMMDVIKAYFSNANQWIPFIHEPRFWARFRDPKEVPRLATLLHGIIVVAIRQVDSPEFALSQAALEEQIRISRNVVMLNAMNQLSIENLQALALVAFDHVR